MVPPCSDRVSRAPPYSRTCRLSTRTGLSPAMARLSRRFRFLTTGHWPGPRSLVTTNGVSVDVLSSGYLDISVRRVRLLALWIQTRIPRRVGCPIRKSADQRVLAPPHGLSQRATSFIASQCQGIHQMPLRRLMPSRTHHTRDADRCRHATHSRARHDNKYARPPRSCDRPTRYYVKTRQPPQPASKPARAIANADPQCPRTTAAFSDVS